ncbi:MAG: 16S rRNA (uracil(1498)-N(3))-methyltransferase [Bacteroidales bacterium]|nr:16S rRNA (uracil(1498)-N(3))-methyltransferase [Bacteroidales bacterium]
MNIFFLNNITDIIKITDDTFNHLKAHHVRVNDIIYFTDGKGSLAKALITDLSKQSITAHILETQLMPIAKTHSTLFAPLLKQSERVDWMIEKAVELGVSNIIPIITELTIKSSIKISRLLNIIKAASLQSLKYYFPTISEPIRFEEAIKLNNNTKRVIAYCGDEINKLDLFEYMNANEDVSIFIGPEGDFTSEEINKAIDYGIIPVSLGHQRLRSETAAIFSLSIFALKNHL